MYSRKTPAGTRDPAAKPEQHIPRRLGFVVAARHLALRSQAALPPLINCSGGRSLSENSAANNLMAPGSIDLGSQPLSGGSSRLRPWRLFSPWPLPAKQVQTWRLVVDRRPQHHHPPRRLRLDAIEPMVFAAIGAAIEPPLGAALR